MYFNRYLITKESYDECQKLEHLSMLKNVLQHQFLDLVLFTGHDARAPYTRHVDKPRGQKSDHATKSRKNVRY